MMLVRKLDPALMTRSCKISMQYLYPWADVTATPFGSAWGIVRSGETSERHAHHESESFFIVSGTGTASANGESCSVEAGDVIFFPPFTKHALYNCTESDLVFLTVWWESMPDALARAATRSDSKRRAPRTIVTSTPPTPNGDLHLGHISGPYLGADIHVRYLRMLGADAYHVSGSDVYQSYVAFKAVQVGSSPAEIADRYTNEIESTLRAIGALPDQFTRPFEAVGYHKAVAAFFEELVASGIVASERRPTLYCEACAAYRYEAYISGSCPHCGSGCNGNFCEECARPHSSAEIRTPKCMICGEKPTIVEIESMHLNLRDYAEQLRKHIDQSAMNSHLRALSETMLENDLPILAVTYPSDWGLDAASLTLEKQKIWVWLEMAPGYLIGIRELGMRLGWWSDPESIWPPEGTALVHFFGIDNGYYHTLLFPLLFRLLRPEIELPIAYVCNEFYCLDGAKFSTSRNHAVWVRPMLQDASRDEVRFFLCWTRPESAQTNFTARDFALVIRSELIDGLQGWLQDLGSRVLRHFDGRAPAPGHWTEAHRHFLNCISKRILEVAEAYEAETFSPQRAARCIVELAREARAFGDAEENWSAVRGRHNEYRTAVALELSAAAGLARMVAPMMPDFAQRLWNDLGNTGSVASAWPEGPEWLALGWAVQLGGDYFPEPGDELVSKARDGSEVRDVVTSV